MEIRLTQFKAGLATKFYIVIGVSIVVGLAFVYSGISVVKMLFWSAILNGLLAPPLVVIVVLLTSDKKVMVIPSTRRNEDTRMGMRHRYERRRNRIGSFVSLELCRVFPALAFKQVDAHRPRKLHQTTLEQARRFYEDLPNF